MSTPRGLYTPVYQSLPRHRKTRLAARALRAAKLVKGDEREARMLVMGHLMTLWTWCLDSIPSEGEPLTAEDIAIAAEWPERTADKFCEVLADAGFLDRCGEAYMIHDWPKYGGKVAARQVYDRERKSEFPRNFRGKVADDAEEHPRNVRGGSRVDETRREKTRSDETRARAREGPPSAVAEGSGWMPPGMTALPEPGPDGVIW